MKTLKGLLNLSRRSARWIIAAVVLIVALYGYYILFMRDPYTADAFVQGNSVQIAARMQGPVTKLFVKNNQRVEKGQALFQVDSSLYQLELEKAQAKLASLQHTSKNQNSYQLKIALASVALAKKRLSFATVYAPVDGVLSSLSIREGSFIPVGKPLFSIIEDKGDWWVQANYLEFELRRLRVGQEANIYLSLYPKTRFKGKVEAISIGVNRGLHVAEATLLPDVKTSISWLRVFSRFPVYIHINKIANSQPMRIGATAAVTVHVK